MLIVVEYQRGTDLTFLGQTDVVIPTMLGSVAVSQTEKSIESAKILS
jgi:hypothetical protein